MVPPPTGRGRHRNTYDTVAVARQLAAGGVARAQASAKPSIRGDGLAEVRAEIADLRTEQRTGIAGVRTEIASLETRLIRWRVGTVIATATLGRWRSGCGRRARRSGCRASRPRRGQRRSARPRIRAYIYMIGGEYPARPLSRDGSCESTPCDARTHQRRLRQARRYASTSGGRTIVRPTRPDGPGHGHPVVFGRALFAALRRADPAPGAKPVVRAHEGEAEDVVVDDAGAFTHIDTPEDYRRAFGAPPPDDSPAGVDPQAHPTYK